MKKLPDAGFVALVDRLKQERAEQIPHAPAKDEKQGAQPQLFAHTEDGQVIPFHVWAKRWSDKNIDGCHVG